MDDKLLTLPEICARYHVSDRRARYIIHRHAVPVLRPGREYVFDERAEMAFREATRLYQDAASERKRQWAATSVPSALRAQRAYEQVLAMTAPGPKKPKGCQPR